MSSEIQTTSALVRQIRELILAAKQKSQTPSGKFTKAVASPPSMNNPDTVWAIAD
jgi:hypothetical protein